jgi:hypothetical protein
MHIRPSSIGGLASCPFPFLLGANRANLHYDIAVIDNAMQQSHVSAPAAVEPGSDPYSWDGRMLDLVERMMLLQGPASVF